MLKGTSGDNNSIEDIITILSGGCAKHSRPATTLECDPKCSVKFSYCNDTNLCICRDKFTAVYNRLGVLLRCVMSNLTNAQTTTSTITLPGILITYNYNLLNSLPNNKILDWFRLKAFADNKLNVAKIMISPYGRVENSVRTCWLSAFSSFPHNVFKRLLPKGC